MLYLTLTNNEVQHREGQMTRELPQLPQEEADRLVALRAAGPNGLPALRARVAALRAAGWSLAAVGAPMGANRSTTRMWQLGAADGDAAASAEETPIPRPPTRQNLTSVRLYPDVPPAERDDLIRLAESARQVRGWTPQDAPTRQDAAEFERRLREYVSRGVPLKRIADHVGVTHRAIAARLERKQLAS